jgi:hypothetical protein
MRGIEYAQYALLKMRSIEYARCVGKGSVHLWLVAARRSLWAMHRVSVVLLHLEMCAMDTCDRSVSPANTAGPRFAIKAGRYSAALVLNLVASLMVLFPPSSMVHRGKFNSTSPVRSCCRSALRSNRSISPFSF